MLSGTERGGFDSARKCERPGAPARLSSIRSQAQASAEQIWVQSQPAPRHHGFLVKHGIPGKGLRLFGRVLLAAAFDRFGGFRGVQALEPDGRQRLFYGARLRGCYWPVGRLRGTLVIAQTVAEAALAHQATGHAAAASLSLGNLPHAAAALRHRFPAARFVVVAVDDSDTPGSPRLTHARQAAQLADAALAVPAAAADRSPLNS